MLWLMRSKKYLVALLSGGTFRVDRSSKNPGEGKACGNVALIRIDRIASEKIREKKKKVDEKKKRKEIEIMNGLFLTFVKK